MLLSKVDLVGKGGTYRLIHNGMYNSFHQLQQFQEPTTSYQLQFHVKHEGISLLSKDQKPSYDSPYIFQEPYL